MNRQLSFADMRPDNAARIAEIHLRRTPISLLLDGVTDPKNVSMLLRLADAVRAETVFFYNCAIPDKQHLKPARAVYPFLLLQALSAEDFAVLVATQHLVAVEHTSSSVAYTDYAFQPHTVLAVGSETRGVSQGVLDCAAAAVHLPMLGVNSSINVACAMSVVLYSALETLSRPV